MEYHNTVGINNIAIGFGALGANTTGNNNILGNFDRKKFYHNNIREIEHIRNMDNISLDDAIDLHYDALQAIKSVFG